MFRQAKLSDTCLVEDIEQDHEFSKGTVVNTSHISDHVPGVIVISLK